MKNVCLLSLLFLATACQFDAAVTPSKDCPFCGNWTYQTSEQLPTKDYATVYQRTPDLLPNRYGIRFLPNGRLTERQNSGWCGTPPITTEDYDGAWQQRGDSLYITVGYWGGKTSSRIFVLSADSNTLKIKRVYR